MTCEHLTLEAGDTLYMPAGTVHFAETTDSEGSIHVTYRMLLEGHKWIDELSARCLDQYTPTMCKQLQTQLGEDATMFAWFRLKNDTTGWPGLPARFAAITPDTYGMDQLDSRGAMALTTAIAGVSRQVNPSCLGK